MAQETQTRDIGGRTFTVSQLPPRRALKLLRRVAALLGPALAQAFGAADAKARKLSPEALGPALEKLFEQLDDAALDALLDGALATARIDGKELLPQFDLVFRGKLPQVFQVLTFALEVHFGDFFGEGGGFLDRLRDLVSNSRTSETSSGPSGDSSPSASPP